MHVLLVEDNDGDADLIRHSLAEVNGAVHVDRVDRMQAAIQWLETRSTDVILLDLTLPDSPGLQGLGLLRAAAPAVALVVLTGAADQRLGQRALYEGAQDYLLKGLIDGPALDRALRQARERQEYRERTRQLMEEQARRAEAEAARTRAIWLAEAGKRLSASVNREATLAAVQAVLVPEFCQACEVYLSPAADPSTLLSPDPELAAAQRTGVTLDRSRGPGRCRVTVPLMVAGRVFGAARFLFATPQGSEVVLLAEELASRAAMALENARHYAESQEAVRAREEFLSVASHELRTPLATLCMQVQLMQRELADQQLSHSHLPGRLQKLRDLSVRLTRLVSTLLDVSLVDSGQLSLSPKPLDLVQLARVCIEGFTAEAEALRCELTLDGDADAAGNWDQLRLEQVFGNLITNALKYGAGKPIRVSVRRGEGAVQVSISDCGPGIPEEERERIFRRYHRLNGTRSLPGLGLGLYLTRQIVEAHGGTIALQRSSPEGSTFTLRLPDSLPAGQR